MTVDMKKVREDMDREWDMTGEEFDKFDVAQANDLNEGWKEIVMENVNDDSDRFFIEVNADSEVWNFERI